MNYEIAFYVLVAFILGRLSKVKVYIGNNREKYESADIGILLRKQP